MIEYTHHSPSGLNLYNAEPAMFGMERLLGMKQPVGAPAHRGSAVEAGVAYGLLNPDTATPETCVEAATVKYDQLMALSPDPRRDSYRKDIPVMVKQALLELLPYGVPDSVQGKIEWHPYELKYPVLGFYDFLWEKHGIVVDLKTTAAMPSEIKISHARQVAFYACSSNHTARLTYVTPKKCHTYTLENINEHCGTLVQIAKRVEYLLELSNNDPQYFKKLFTPNLDSFYWNNPRARQLAWEHWQI